MRPVPHVITSGIISIFVWSHFQSFWCALISFLFGFVIDLDHIIDYTVSHGFTCNLKDVYDRCNASDLRRLYLVLHSYELLAVLWAVIALCGLSDLWKAAAIGMTQHLIFDTFTNPLKKSAYFFTYRFAKGFKSELLFKPT